ncbi:MAG: amino acid permease [Candidatus Nanopelagicales bacterium]|nr:amino acid permease [Candidatus Nanopelagicales bacterium]
MSETTKPSTTVEEADKGRALGLPQATALIVGGIVGTGLFGMPGLVGSYGMMSVLTLVVVTIGAMALALMFGSLVKRIPAAGGPYAYSRFYFGDFAGFTSAWPYWITAWAGNAGIVVIWTNYVISLFGLDNQSRVIAMVIAMIGLWIPAFVNLAGVKNMGAFQVITTILKFVPLVFVVTVGLVFAFGRRNFPEFNTSGTDFLTAFSTCAALLLFSYLGVELASVAAGKIRNPEKNVPRATILGTLVCGIAYILSLIAILGIVPTDTLNESGSASFSVAMNEIFGGTWAGTIMSAFIVISGIGALNGWTMICAEMPQAAANEDLFPKFFAKVSKRGVPYWGIIFSTALASAFTLFAYLTTASDELSAAGSTGVLGILVLLTGVTAAVPYFFSALAQIFYLMTKGRVVQPKTFAKDMVIGVAAMLFSFWFVFGSGEQATFYAYLIILIGYGVLTGLYIRRKRNNLPIQGDQSSAV